MASAISIRSGLLTLIALTIGTPPTRAQMAMSGTGRSLGGYGASAISSYYGGAGGGYIPYAGGGSGYVPYRGGAGGGGMGVQPIQRRLPETSIGGVMMATTPIGGASLSGGRDMPSRGGMAMGARSSARTFLPFGYDGGLGMGGGMTSMSTAGMGGTRRSPSGPGFGYPFRMPPSLAGSSSMSMP